MPATITRKILFLLKQNDSIEILGRVVSAIVNIKLDEVRGPGLLIKEHLATSQTSPPTPMLLLELGHHFIDYGLEILLIFRVEYPTWSS